jgi:hypothetical protein
VGPAGQKVVLKAGAGGTREVEDVDLTLDDAASNALPLNARLSSGTYRPANYTQRLAFHSPAPGAPYAAALAAFNSTNPNGVWNLYLQDSQRDDNGALENGWSLTLTAK